MSMAAAMFVATATSVHKGQVLAALIVAIVIGAIAAVGHWAWDEGVGPFRSRRSGGSDRSRMADHGGDS